jgi:hypothetical protein
MRRWFVVAAAVTVVTSGAIAHALIPDANGVFHGCFSTTTGVVRVIDNPTLSCKADERAISWNQTGPQGSAGPAGPPATLPAFINEFGAGHIDPFLLGTGAGLTCAIGEVRLFAGSFVPPNTLLADGRLLPIPQNQVLFSILGTLYGGDGVHNFRIPDLRAFAPNGVSYVLCTSGIFP